MKKLLLVLLCLPMIGFSAGFDYQKIGFGVQLNSPYIVGCGISYKVYDNQKAEFFVSTPLASYSGFYFEYDYYTAKITNNINPLLYVLIGNVNVNRSSYNRNTQTWSNTNSTIGMSLGIGVEMYYKKLSEKLKLNIKLGYGKNPDPNEMSGVNFSTGIHYYL